MKKQFRILVVDDEQVNIKSLVSALADTYDVSTAESGYDAIKQIKEQMPDLIVLDVMMPEFNGFEVCSTIKSDASFADIPVIFLTSMDTLAGEIKGFECGGIDYLTKPVSLDLLKLRVRNHIALKERNELVKEQRDLLLSRKKELEAALARVKQLEGIIPICMYCKKIREDDEKSWSQLEKYISAHSEALFSHGICPTCLAQHYPDDL